MYRVIFLFDVSDLYPQVREAGLEFFKRKPHLRKRLSIDNAISAWFFNHLWNDQVLALIPTNERHFVDFLDSEYLHFCQVAVARFYRQINMAINPNSHPHCYHSWCTFKVNENDLRLFFEIGPVDYSHYTGLSGKDPKTCF